MEGIPPAPSYKGNQIAIVGFAVKPLHSSRFPPLSSVRNSHTETTGRHTFIHLLIRSQEGRNPTKVSYFLGRIIPMHASTQQRMVLDQIGQIASILEDEGIVLFHVFDPQEDDRDPPAGCSARPAAHRYHRWPASSKSPRDHPKGISSS